MVSQQGDTVITRLSRAQLSGALTALHRGGFGHLTKVLDPGRSSISGQLSRLGITLPTGFTVNDDCVAVVVMAPAQTGVVEEIFRYACGCQCWTVGRTATTNPMLLASFGAKSRQRKQAQLEPVSTD